MIDPSWCAVPSRRLVAGIEKDELTFPAGPDEYDGILEATGKLG